MKRIVQAGLCLLLCCLLVGCTGIPATFSEYQSRRAVVSWLPELDSLKNATFSVSYRGGFSGNAVVDVLELRYDDEASYAEAKKKIYDSYQLQTAPMPDGQSPILLTNGYMIQMLSMDRYDLQWPRRLGFVALHDIKKRMVFISFNDTTIGPNGYSLKSLLNELYSW